MTSLICCFSLPVSFLFFALSNGFHLVFKLRLLFQQRIDVLGLIDSASWAQIAAFDDVPQYGFQRFAVLFVHAERENGIMEKIMRNVAMLPGSTFFVKKKSGTPMSAPPEKQTTCRFVRFRISFCLTFVRSFGMGTYATFILLIKYKSSCGKSKNLRFLAGYGAAPHIVPPSFSPISAHEICFAPSCLS